MMAASAQVVSCCVYDKSKKIMQHMYGIIPYKLHEQAHAVGYSLSG